MRNLVDVSWVLKGRFSASINIVQYLSFILLAFVPKFFVWSLEII